jgi:mono/diheme cytochrome c family protein
MRFASALLIWPLMSLAAQAGDYQSDALPPDWSTVGVIFSEQCTMCHGPQGAARGLRLDSYAAAVAGSDNGPVLVGGDADESELIRRLRGISTPRMPFLGYPLSDERIDLIARWIDAGMPDAK